MFRINTIEDGLELFKALGSDIRLEILQRIQKEQGMSMGELARAVHLSSSSLSQHIACLNKCGLIQLSEQPAAHGLTRICRVSEEANAIYITFQSRNELRQSVNEVPIGLYSEASVTPTCGLAMVDGIVGRWDMPRGFFHPLRGKASILWFTTGYVEYILPNLIPDGARIRRFALSFEIASEARGYNDHYPSDIHFYLNGHPLGIWVCPGDFGEVRGKYNPDWWYPDINQYGLLKQLVIDENGTRLDGETLSDARISDFALTSESTLRFRFAVPEDTKHPGGLTLYGRGFGNYGQNPRLTLDYDEG